MVTTSLMAEVASLVGEPARAAMLQAMMDGRALTATELARAAGVGRHPFLGASPPDPGTFKSSRTPA